MDLREFLSRLEGVKAGSGGEYICKCPAHDDRTASLCVRDGEKGIVLKCQAGCPTEAVLARMGLKMRDLFHEPLQKGKQGQTAHSARKPPAPPGSPPSPPIPAPKEAEKPRMTFICAYDYRDENGKLIYQACRYINEASGKKTFRLRQPDANAKGGWRYDKKGVRLVLYRLPEVAAAIREGGTVYVVEGEKDADTLAQNGHTATTNAMGAGKWMDEYAESLKGAARICIIPDNDDVGREHARTVARSVYPHVKEVRILDLKKACPKLPEKGDITDMFEMMEPGRADAALARLIAETAPYDGDDRSDYEKAVDYYNGVFGYCIEGGRICQNHPDGAKPLGNFVALPCAVVISDDGANRSKEMVIDGWRSDGKPLERIRIKANQYSAMAWVSDNWDFDANIMPGSATRDRLRYVIGEVGRMSAKHIVEYDHTGWRRINGKWAFLYQGGAIGAEDVTVNLDSGLTRYRLDGSGAKEFGEIAYADAAAVTMHFRDIMAETIAIPLLSTIFLAPLREFLDQTDIGPAYSLFLLGGTGTHKSTVAALGLSHFGNFHYKSLPANFGDTGNSIRKKAFLLKDVPIVVDDFHPVSSVQERKTMEGIAQTLSRAFGDGADRGRLGNNLTLQRAMPPRGIAIISGEDEPGITQSGLERYYIVNLHKGDVQESEELTEMQELARKGYLQRCMQGYIKWLIKQVEQLPEMLHGMFLQYRAMAADLTPNQHGRSREMIAHMMIGYELMLNYMRDVGLLSTEECRTESDRAWQILVQGSRQQSEDLQAERPSRMFLTAVGELLISHTANVRDLASGGDGIPKDMIGYCDAMFYYLLPNAAYRAVVKMFTDQGRAFPLTMRALYKQLREDGVITSDTSDRGGAATKGKWIDGRTQRLLWIPRAEIDGRKEIREQMRMAFDGGAQDGFVETGTEDLPEEFRE